MRTKARLRRLSDQSLILRAIADILDAVDTRDKKEAA